MRREATFNLTGADVRKARQSAGLTQRQLAEKAHLHVNSVKRLERFDRILQSSWHAVGRCAAHLEGIGPVSRITPFRPRPVDTTLTLFKPTEVQFSTAITRAPHGVLVQSKSAKAKCGAKTRRGTACIAPARANGRCRMHGGLSTGPKTVEGRRRIAAAQHRRWARYRSAQEVHHAL